MTAAPNFAFPDDPPITAKDIGCVINPALFVQENSGDALLLKSKASKGPYKPTPINLAPMGEHSSLEVEVKPSLLKDFFRAVAGGASRLLRPFMPPSQEDFLMHHRSEELSERVRWMINEQNRTVADDCQRTGLSQEYVEKSIAPIARRRPVVDGKRELEGKYRPNVVDLSPMKWRVSSDFTRSDAFEFFAKNGRAELLVAEPLLESAVA